MAAQVTSTRRLLHLRASPEAVRGEWRDRPDEEDVAGDPRTGISLKQFRQVLMLSGELVPTRDGMR